MDALCRAFLVLTRYLCHASTCMLHMVEWAGVQAVRVCVTQAVRVRVTSPSSWDGEAGATCGLPVYACAARISSPLHVPSEVLIAAPRDATSHLLDQSSATCTGTGEAAFYWQLLRSTVIREPGCGSDEKWTMMVSAGYAMAAGTCRRGDV